MESKYVPVLNVKKNSDETEGISKLCEMFESTFGLPPSLVVRVPGRVNLIGEHIDYHGFAVLPMALENDILMAISSNKESKIVLRNVENDKYDDYSDFSNVLNISATPCWFNYFLCGYRGIVEKFCLNGACNETNNIVPSIGLNALISGTIPPSAGLSSSSALVCAAALSTLCLLKDVNAIDKTEIVEISTVSERYIGTQGGGMDQAIAFMAEKGCAKLIEFEPCLKSNNVTLPRSSVFYIIHSGTTLNKAATHHFNERVFETRVAAALIAKKCNITAGDYVGQKKYLSLRDVMIALGKNCKQMSQSLKEYLQPKCYTVDDILQELSVNKEQLLSMISGYSENVAKKFKRVLEENGNCLLLFNRALHVYQEANRVLCVKQICEMDVSAEEKIRLVANLMNESHDSCKKLYECSCEQLDETVDKALRAGALGARLTGAGWGGCVVALLPESSAANFEDNIKLHSKLYFRSKPSEGALIYKIE